MCIRGGSAKIICEAKGDKALYLFDTFEGLPRIDKIDSSGFSKGQFASSYGKVKNYLKKYKNVHIYKGVFPDTSEPIRNKQFSFVHLDVDTYKSTLDCLCFFYPRIVKSGIIISHDYFGAKGVKRAFDEFFKNKPELVELVGIESSQCLVKKL